MVARSHALEWTSAECRLRWHSPRTYHKAEEVYIRLWGLIQTVNTTTAQYHAQWHACRDARRKAVIAEHLAAKNKYYPQDDFPLIAFHPTNVSYRFVRLQQGECVSVTLAFGGEYRHLAADWLQWFALRLGMENTGVTLENKPKLVNHKVVLPPLTASKLAQCEAAMAQAQELTLLIDMPANLTPNKSLDKQLQHLSALDRLKHTLLAHSQKRLCQWFVAQQSYIEKWFAQWQAVLVHSPLCMYQLHQRHGIKTISKSSGLHSSSHKKSAKPSSNKSAASAANVQWHQGHAGFLTLKGAWCVIPELWQVLADIHLLGQRTQINGLGYFLSEHQLQTPPPTLWQRHIVNKDEIQKAVGEVLTRYELEPVVDEAGKLMEAEALSELVYHQLSTHSYVPQPTQAFYVSKPSGGKRCLEELPQFDMIVHRLVFNALVEIIDQSQSPLSVGYRKGYSRQLAADKVQALIQAGFTWVVEADIEAFFDEVPFERLWARMAQILPEREHDTIALIKQLMQVSYMASKRADGRAIERVRDKGLMQGSPLSPILANVYLSMLDAQIQAEKLAFVRYADDMLIFCRSEKDASHTLTDLTQWLAVLGLNLALDKSAITPVSEGFEFLGYRFDNDDPQDNAIVPILRQRKPIMITGARKYLGVNGEALEIRERKPRQKPNAKC